MRVAGVIACFVAFGAVEATAQTPAGVVICKKTSDGNLTLRNRRCRTGETKVSNISSLVGQDGADGSLRIYGDGSSGPLAVSSSTSFTAGSVNQFTDCSVAAGVTLTVPSGATIRCSGTFTNDGTITVSPSAYQSVQLGSIAAASGGIQAALRAPSGPGLGMGRTAGSLGGYGTNGALIAGGPAGFGMSSSTAKNILKPGLFGGGSGGTGYGSFGSDGGGTLTILAAGAITNNGTIAANGEDPVGNTGGGGGAGGIIILASKTSVTNAAGARIEVTGSDGAAASSSRGAGGGGGGGIVHLLAPTITDAGTVDVSGGAAGASGTVSAAYRSGGGGGGSCGGGGGAGDDVASGNSSSGAGAGTVGLSLTTQADPTSLF